MLHILECIFSFYDIFFFVDIWTGGNKLWKHIWQDDQKTDYPIHYPIFEVSEFIRL
jgi:hypothetical protein